MKVGDRMPELRRAIELPTLVRYAGASGDFNQIHYDADFAREAGLPGVIGHGALAMGLVSAAITDWVGDSRQVRSLEVRFKNPYRLGDELSVSGEVVGEADGVLEISLRCVNQENVEIIGGATVTVAPEERSEDG